MIPEKIQESGIACGCGRSPTGRCIGWHDLTEDQYWDRLRDFTVSSMADPEQEQYPQQG